jgi:uncharacterized protein (DUF433 family)
MAVRKVKRELINLPLLKERVGEREIVYYPLGNHLAIMPGVCGGRPTVKFTRIDARAIIGALQRGDTPEQIVAAFDIPLAAIDETVQLSESYDYEKSYT